MLLCISSDRRFACGNPSMLVRTLACVLTVVATGLGNTPAAAQENAPNANTKLGDQYIPLDGIVATVLSPAKLMSCDSIQLLPLEIAEAWCLDNIGFAPQDCESIRLISATPGPSGAMGAVIVKLNKPFAIADLNPQLVRADETVEIDGFSCLPINGPPGVVVHQPDPSTFIIASSNYLETVIDAADGGQTGQLSELARVVNHDGHFTMLLAIKPVRPMINGGIQAFANQLPPQLAQFTELPNLLDAILIRIDLDDSEKGAQLAMLATDDAAAEKIETMMDEALMMGRQIAMQAVMQNVRDEGPVPDATRAYAQRMADQITEVVKPERAGRRLTLSASPSQGLVAQSMLLGVLVPAVQGARVGGLRVGAARQGAGNNLKQIGLAMHNYHSAYRKLPDAVNRDADGKPLLSWRVHILPFVEEQALYREFHLDEPWDSEHNIKLLPRMPEVYRHPSMNPPQGETVYQVPIGDGTMFKTDDSTRFRDILDGLSNTIMIVQSDMDSAVPWTKPVDLQIDADDPAATIGFVNDQTTVLIGDGSTQDLAKDTAAEVWNAMFSRDARD